VLQAISTQTGATTGWLPHTTRAAVTGLHKRGFTVDLVAQDDRKAYRHLPDRRPVIGPADRQGVGFAAGIDPGRCRYPCCRRCPEGISASYASRLIRLTWLAPGIVQAILRGRQPPGVSVTRLFKDWRLPSIGEISSVPSASPDASHHR
jgi:hypothetical protein